ncbi:MAG TPA: fluoride efflux transporter CrcB [Candidatus Udaeobacter sp.]
MRDRSFVMLSYLLVGIGGAIGSVARFWVSGLIATRFGQTFPLGTLVVNVTGSFVIGLFSAFSEPEGRWLVNPSFRQFFMIGICGGYTTFSSFSLQTLALAQEGEWFHAFINSIASFALCLFAVWLGYFAITLINKP